MQKFTNCAKHSMKFVEALTWESNFLTIPQYEQFVVTYCW